jgi:hypothetical protein
MSDIVRYTLIGEGFAEYQFIPAYMNWAVKQTGDLQAIKTNIQIAITKNRSVSKVLQEAATSCARSFADDKKHVICLLLALIWINLTLRMI